jgi:hypothetical protein
MRQREVRKYEKNNDKYWTEDIRAARKRSMPAVEGNDEDNLLPSQPSLDPKTMKLGDLREELKRRGVHGCSRERKAELIEVLQNELKQQTFNKTATSIVYIKYKTTVTPKINILIF